MDTTMLSIIRRGVVFDAVLSFQSSPETTSIPPTSFGCHDPHAIDGLLERYFEKFLFMTEELGNSGEVVEQREILLNELEVHALDAVADIDAPVIRQAVEGIKAKYGKHLVRNRGAAHSTNAVPRH